MIDLGHILSELWPSSIRMLRCWPMLAGAVQILPGLRQHHRDWPNCAKPWSKLHTCAPNGSLCVNIGQILNFRQVVNFSAIAELAGFHVVSFLPSSASSGPPASQPPHRSQMCVAGKHTNSHDPEHKDEVLNAPVARDGRREQMANFGRIRRPAPGKRAKHAPRILFEQCPSFCEASSAAESSPASILRAFVRDVRSAPREHSSYKFQRVEMKAGVSVPFGGATPTRCSVPPSSTMLRSSALVPDETLPMVKVFIRAESPPCFLSRSRAPAAAESAS